MTTGGAILVVGLGLGAVFVLSRSQASAAATGPLATGPTSPPQPVGPSNLGVIAGLAGPPGQAIFAASQKLDAVANSSYGKYFPALQALSVYHKVVNNPGQYASATGSAVKGAVTTGLGAVGSGLGAAGSAIGNTASSAYHEIASIF